MDDLARIERIYGCVQEYYRCMEEEGEEEYKPTKEEKLESEKEMYLYDRKIEILNGKPSDFAVALNNEWEAKKPKDESDDWKSYNRYCYAIREWGNDKTLDVTKRVCDYYKVEVDEEGRWETFYGSDNFAIEVEYEDYGCIKSKNIGNISYEIFQKVFRDLYCCGLRPVIKCGKMIRRNMSLGELKISDFAWDGIETEESLQTELLANGYNEEEEIKKFMEGRK